MMQRQEPSIDWLRGRCRAHLKLGVHISRSPKLNKLAQDDPAADEQPRHAVLLQQLCLCLVSDMLPPALDHLQCHISLSYTTSKVDLDPQTVRIACLEVTL